MRPSDPEAARPASGLLAPKVHRDRVELQAVLARDGLRNARVFGSVARGDEDSESDADLLVDVPEGEGLVTLGRCQAELEALLAARIDLVPAVDAIRAQVERSDVHDGLVFGAVRVRLIEMGETVRALPAELLASEPALPWARIVAMHHRLAHRSFDTSYAILAATASDELPELEVAVRRLRQRPDDESRAIGPGGSRLGPIGGNPRAFPTEAQLSARMTRLNHCTDHAAVAGSIPARPTRRAPPPTVAVAPRAI